jgi:hypothetical protein
VAIAVAVAVAIGLIAGHSLPDYDAAFALIWGRDIAHANAPDYSLPYRPAGHPLTTLVGVLGTPLGREGAAELLRWVALLGAGAFVAAIFRFGQALFGTLAAVIAALLLATRSPLWGFSELMFMDAWAAAFVVWAALLEYRRPRRGAPVFVLLALAGLLRPEVWLFAGAYWLWIAVRSRRRALRLLPLAFAAPIAWGVWDLVTVQSFLGSVSTDEGLPNAVSTGGHGVSRIPSALARFIGGFVMPPAMVAAIAGALLLARAAPRRAMLPAVLIGLNVFTFVLVATRKGPLEQRYLLVAIGMVVLLAGYAIAQVREIAADRRVRLARMAAAVPGTPRVPGIPNPRSVTRMATAIRIGAAVLAAACIAYAPVDIRRIDDLRDQVSVSDAVYSNLRDLVQAPGASCALRGHVHVPDVRLRPQIAYWGDVAPKQVGTEAGGTGALEPRSAVAVELSSRSLPRDPDVRLGRAPFWRLERSCARQ